MSAKEKVKKGEMTVAEALTLVPKDTKTHRWLKNHKEVRNDSQQPPHISTSRRRRRKRKTNMAHKKRGATSKETR